VITSQTTPSTEARRETRQSQSSIDAAARRLLSSVCAPVAFDRLALAAAAASFPVAREPVQDILSGTWGRVAVLDVGPTGVINRTRAVEGISLGFGFREGRSFRLVLGPGVAACSSFDATRRERAAERATVAARGAVDQVIKLPLFKPYDVGAPSRVITGWSMRSRARMVRAFGSVDWSGLLRCYCGVAMSDLRHTYVAAERCDISQALPLAMVTLTYPGDWLAVAPDGATAKRHLARFRQRWARAMGWRLDGAWKMEFQKPRGWRCDDCRDYGDSTGQEAPHFHLLVPVPATVGGLPFWEKGRGSSWLADTWADVVGAVGQERVNHEAAGTDVDFGRSSTMSDPKRLGIYFLKHGSKTLDAKEYQHDVPAAWQAPGKGPGRFWGFWGLRPATVALDLDLGDWLTVRRTLRNVARARERGVKYSRAFNAARACGLSSAESARLGVASAANPKTPRGIRGPKKLRTLGVGGQLSGGWVIVNDGPALARALGRAVNLRRLVEADWGNGDL